MLRLRSILVPLSAAWLSVHILAMTGPTILALTSGSSDLVCTCAHGADHGTCPMHRTRTDATRCQLQGTQNDLGTVLSLLGPLMLPTSFTAAFLDAAVPYTIPYSSMARADWIVPPEPPPPRS